MSARSDLMTRRVTRSQSAALASTDDDVPVQCQAPSVNRGVEVEAAAMETFREIYKRRTSRNGTNCDEVRRVRVEDVPKRPDAPKDEQLSTSGPAEPGIQSNDEDAVRDALTTSDVQPWTDAVMAVQS